MAQWLWTLLVFAIIAPLHVLVVSPALAHQPGWEAALVAVGYFVVGVIWSYAGDRFGLVRR